MITASRRDMERMIMRMGRRRVVVMVANLHDNRQNICQEGVT